MKKIALLISVLFQISAQADVYLGNLVLKTAPAELQSRCPQDPDGDINRNYVMNAAPSVNVINEMFQALPYGNGGRFRNQCYMRAHIWSYLMWRDYGVKSLKVFMFFANQSSLLDSGWWFHVAPMVIDNKGQAYVMDKQFTDKPMTLEAWQEVFVRKGVRCPTVNNYQVYEKNKNSFDCFIRIVPMYYHQPLDIENADMSGVPKDFTEWNSNELYMARKHFPWGARVNINRLR